MADFVKDVKSAPTGTALVDDQLLRGADHCWHPSERCEAQKDTLK